MTMCACVDSGSAPAVTDTALCVGLAAASADCVPQFALAGSSLVLLCLLLATFLLFSRLKRYTALCSRLCINLCYIVNWLLLLHIPSAPAVNCGCAGGTPTLCCISVPLVLRVHVLPLCSLHRIACWFLSAAGIVHCLGLLSPALDCILGLCPGIAGYLASTVCIVSAR